MVIVTEGKFRDRVTKMLGKNVQSRKMRNLPLAKISKFTVTVYYM